MLYVNLPVKPLDVSSKWPFFYLSLFWWPFSVTIATDKVQAMIIKIIDGILLNKLIGHVGSQLPSKLNV